MLLNERTAENLREYESLSPADRVKLRAWRQRMVAIKGEAATPPLHELARQFAALRRHVGQGEDVRLQTSE